MLSLLLSILIGIISHSRLTHAQAPLKITGSDIDKINKKHCEGTPGYATCKYTLVASEGWMTSTGFSKTKGDTDRSVMVYNESYPGPTIVITEGDKLEVTIMNHLPNATTVHWHGIWQKETPWMDGVPGVSEVHVGPGDTFVYNVNTVVGEHGTYWYHSHFGLQYADGLYGSLILRHRPKDHLLYFPEDADSKSSFTEEDANKRDLVVHIAGLSTWPADEVEDMWNNSKLLLPDSVNNLVFGGNVRLEKLEVVNSKRGKQTTLATRKPDNLVCTGTDAADFMHYIVEPCPSNSTKASCGCLIRFGNLGAVAPMHVSIQDHTGEVVEADGPFVKSNYNQTRYISMLVAQRYSLVYDCKPPTPGENNYWIAAVALTGRGGTFNSTLIDQTPRGCAILHYGNDTPVDVPKADYDFTPPSGCIKKFGTNNCDGECLNSDLNSNSQIRCLERSSGEISLEEEHETENECNVTIHVTGGGAGKPFYLNMSQTCTDDRYDRPEMKGTYKDPDDGIFSLCRAWQSQGMMSDVNQTGLTNNLILPLDHTVYVTLSAGGGPSVHPWHIHGYDLAYHGYWVDGDQPDRERATAIRRDTIAFPFAGKSLYSFVSNNPGSWIAHCHIEGHLGSGFAMVATTTDTSKDAIPPSPVGNCPAPDSDDQDGDSPDDFDDAFMVTKQT